MIQIGNEITLMKTVQKHVHEHYKGQLQFTRFK